MMNKPALLALSLVVASVTLLKRFRSIQLWAIPSASNTVYVHHQANTSNVAKNASECLTLRGSHGRWVHDWEYANRSDYWNNAIMDKWQVARQHFQPTVQQPFLPFTAWAWQDEYCPIHELALSSFCQACYELDVRNILLVGDSLTFEMAQSIKSLLGFPPHSRQTGFKARMKPYPIQCSLDLDSNHNNNTRVAFSVTFLTMRRSPLGDFLWLPKDAVGKDFVDSTPYKTAVIANAGVWLQNWKDFRLAISSLITWMGSLNSTKTILFYRPSVPGHVGCQPSLGSSSSPWLPRGNDSDVDAFNWTNPVMVPPYSSYEEYQTVTRMIQAKYREQDIALRDDWDLVEFFNAHAKQEITNAQKQNSVTIHWLNIFNSSILRRDGHVGFHDCLHYSLPGPVDWWSHIFHSTLVDLAAIQRQQQQQQQQAGSKSSSLLS